MSLGSAPLNHTTHHFHQLGSQAPLPPMSNSSAPAKPYLLAAIFWIAAVVVFFSPVFFQGKVIAPLDIMESLLRPWATAEKIQVHNAFTYDAISQYLPYDYSVYQSLRQDGYIGWNPYTHSGTSIVENTMICPGDWRHHLYRFLPFWTAWNTGIILQFTIAGLGMLILLRDQKIPAAYALLGVIAFGFYSQFILWINHRWILGAMCWAPWILWALFRAIKSDKIIHLPSITFIALAFRGGHLQACVFVVLMVAIVAFYHAAPHIIKRKFHTAIRTLLPYTISGILAAILTLDVIVETVPALLEGNKTMPDRGFMNPLLSLPTLASSILPTIMGTPQSLDLTKQFTLDLFAIKFMGATAVILAALGLLRRDAPILAKCLIIIGILVPFTPADKWLYSRFTVVFALGGAWLATWYIGKIANEPPSRLWKRIAIAASFMIAIWAIGSTAVALNHDAVSSKLNDAVVARLAPEKAAREAWMIVRSENFLQQTMLWHPRNLIFISLIAVGLYACSRINNQSNKNAVFSIVIAICTFGEILTFSKTWVTFSKRPEIQALYEEPAWATRLRSEIGQGTVLCAVRTNFDYMQLNTPSAYGIRFAEGYETVTPSRINPYTEPRYDNKRCAQAGISHLIVAPENDPGSIAGWERVSGSTEYVLYRNPEFKGVATAALESGEVTAVPLSFDTANQRTMILPAGVISISIAESYNAGWKYSLDGVNWSPVSKNEINGMTINIPRVTIAGDTMLKLKYRPAYQSYYRPIMGLTALCLIGFSVHRRNMARRLTIA
jgi:hypothetical protein